MLRPCSPFEHLKGEAAKYWQSDLISAISEGFQIAEVHGRHEDLVLIHFKS
jgi:hypothetical protein